MEGLQKILKITIVVLACVGVGGVLWWGITHLRAPGTSTQTPNTNQPSGSGALYPVTVGVSQTATSTSTGSTQDVVVNTIELKGNGVMVRTLDFTKDPSVENNSQGVYALSGGLRPTPNATPYSTLYSVGDQSFVVTLLQEPLGSNRLVAEQTLQKQLGIDQAAMCQLNYFVGVPSAVNETYAGKNLGFSFCPGAAELPL
jgi:hypothetical protein